MVMNRFRPIVTSLIVLALLTGQALAQREMYSGPPTVNPSGYDPDLSQPFIEPMAFDPDFQFFAPAGVDRLGGEIGAPIGWFGTYDKTYLYVTRPEDQQSGTQGDFSWGNRFDLGYMSPENHGWLVSFLHIDGPNNYRILEAERINVF